MLRQLRDAPARLENVPQLAWADFLGELRWYQGEHVTLLGPTGQGKSTAAHQLLHLRRYSLVLATKPEDSTLRMFERDGWRKLDEWPPPPDWQRVLLWPRFRRPSDLLHQRLVIRDALAECFAVGRWCVYADEGRYITETLRAADLLRLYWLQGRALKLSLMFASQRPAFVPLEAYDQATHLFLWGDNDEANLRRIGGIGGMSARVVRELVSQLPPHDVLYVNTRDRTIARTRVERA